MAHDPLCAFAPCDCYKHGSGMHSCGTDTCQCDLIEKVREDQDRRQAARELTQLAQEMGLIP